MCTLKLYYQEKVIVCASALGNKALLTCSKCVHWQRESKCTKKKKKSGITVGMKMFDSLQRERVFGDSQCFNTVQGHIKGRSNFL